MPTPLDIFLNPFLNPVAYTCMAIYAALIGWEHLFPASRLPRVPYWQLRGLAAFVVYFLLSSYLPLWWDATLVEYRLFDFSTQSVWLQAMTGILAYEFLMYWWHRTMHSVDWLWRIFHQMHHSAERLDTFGAFWLSPLDMAGFMLMASLALTLILGVNVEAATLVLYVTFFLSVFQHANIRTPQWLGYFVQRPESHSRHHGKGLHRDNYADLPLFDLLFGTFQNPAMHRETGFYPGASSQLIDMLLWRDLNARVKPQPDMVSVESG